jgi:hypothetical protein
MFPHEIQNGNYFLRSHNFKKWLSPLQKEEKKLFE